MAQLRVKKKFCDRCIKDTPATTTERFTYAAVDYEIDLCDRHAEMFQRDMFGWTRLSREKERPTTFGRTSVELDNHRRLARSESDRAAERRRQQEQQSAESQQPQLETIPGPALEWTLSKHAEEQLKKRGPLFGFGKREVLLAAHTPEASYLADDGVCYRQNRGSVSVVVDRTRRSVVTVMPNLPNWDDSGEQKQEALSGNRNV